jgi:S1-C subfamily serine protease
MRAALLAGVALAAAAAAAGCGGSRETVTATTTVVETQTTTVTTAAPAAPAPGGSTADVVARVLKGVVNVETVGFDGTKGEGSGVVIGRRGIIVTNNHVVEGARTVRVSFNDGRHLTPVRASVVGTAPERDLAILRVQLNDLVPVELGRSSRLRLGDGVLAIGFPLELGGPTVTQGIVSGLDRTYRPERGPVLEGLLQTDAAINPGNSGGALVDLQGRLVGINTAAARAGAAENVGFAIAIDAARPVIAEIQAKPAGQRAWLGIAFDSVETAAEAAQLGLPPDTRGAAATAVYAGGPGAQAGVQPGDVVTAIDGKPVRSSEDATKLLGALRPGDSVTLELVDRIGPRRVTVTIDKRPATLPPGG